jgi:hypothetical protein
MVRSGSGINGWMEGWMLRVPVTRFGSCGTGREGLKRGWVIMSRHETSGELSHHFGSKVIELKCSALGKRWLFQPLFID